MVELTDLTEEGGDIPADAARRDEADPDRAYDHPGGNTIKNTAMGSVFNRHYGVRFRSALTPAAFTAGRPDGRSLGAWLCDPGDVVQRG